MTASAEQLVAVVSYAPTTEQAANDIARILGLEPASIAGDVDEIVKHVDAADAIRADAPFADCPHRHPHCIAPGCGRAALLRNALTETGRALAAAEVIVARVLGVPA